MIREPVFAYQGWYPERREIAEHELSFYLKSEKEPTPALAVVSPHAGWTFSGPTAGRLYAQIVVPDRVAVLCPMHRAGGERVAVWPKGTWRTPLGDMQIDEDFASAFIERSDLARVDYDGHKTEHAIEIQLPFLQTRNPSSRLIPIRLGYLDYEAVRKLGHDLAETIKESEGETLIVASSDMSHESDPELVELNDRIAREKVIGLDALGLMDEVEARKITMCGYLAAAVAIEAALVLGATKAEEVAYTTSAEVSGRTDYVVGYLAARIDS